MFVVVQFPIADGRAFASDTGQISRPDWLAPTITPFVAQRDFVRGFGRQAHRRLETSAAWTDEDFFVYGRHALRFPTLARRHFLDADGRRWRVSCRFRRLFGDGVALIRYEVGFEVRSYVREDLISTPALRSLLALPVHVPGEMATDRTAPLISAGPYLSRRYARGTTRHGSEPAFRLVQAGAPLVVAEVWESLKPDGAVEAAHALKRPGRLSVAVTRTPVGNVETWYLHDVARDVARNARLVVVHRHAQEEVLDRVLRWATTGTLSYVPRSAAGDRLEEYVNKATSIVNRDAERGVELGPLRAALNEATTTQRSGVLVRRRERLDGMRRQIRAKAEQFLEDRDATSPVFNVNWRVHMGDVNRFEGAFYGPVAGTVHAGKMENSFNALVSKQPDESIRSAMAELHTQVADLIARMDQSAPDEATEVADAVAAFTDEAAKDKPNKITLRALGQGIISAAKSVAEVATPVATAVGAVLKILGVAAM